MEITFTIFAQALAFAGLIWIVATKIWPPLLRAIEERQQRITEGLAAADQSEKALETAQEQAQDILRQARAKASDIIDQAHVRANQMIEEANAQALTSANRQKEQAQAEIAASVIHAREELRQQLGALAVRGAEKILKREIDMDAHKALVDALVAEI